MKFNSVGGASQQTVPWRHQISTREPCQSDHCGNLVEATPSAPVTSCEGPGTTCEGGQRTRQREAEGQWGRARAALSGFDPELSRRTLGSPGDDGLLYQATLLHHRLSLLCLTNPGSWCSLNAIFMGVVLVWRGTLAVSESHPIQIGDAMPKRWMSLPLLAHWSVEHAPNRQNDAAEFLQYLLRWAGDRVHTCLTCNGRKNGMPNQDVETRDTGGPYLPITLQFASGVFVRRVRSLLQDWNTDDGMLRCLVGNPDLLCVHLERWTGTDADNVMF